MQTSRADISKRAKLAGSRLACYGPGLICPAHRADLRAASAKVGTGFPRPTMRQTREKHRMIPKVESTFGSRCLGACIVRQAQDWTGPEYIRPGTVPSRLAVTPAALEVHNNVRWVSLIWGSKSDPQEVGARGLSPARLWDAALPPARLASGAAGCAGQGPRSNGRSASSSRLMRCSAGWDRGSSHAPASRSAPHSTGRGRRILRYGIRFSMASDCASRALKEMAFFCMRL